MIVGRFLLVFVIVLYFYLRERTATEENETASSVYKGRGRLAIYGTNRLD